MFILEPTSRASHVNKERKKNKKTTQQRKKRDEGASRLRSRVTSPKPVSGPGGRWARETPNHLGVAGYPLSNHSGRQGNSAHVIARDSRAMLTGHPFERQNITEASCLCDFFNGFSLPV